MTRELNATGDAWILPVAEDPVSRWIVDHAFSMDTSNDVLLRVEQALTFVDTSSPRVDACPDDEAWTLSESDRLLLVSLPGGGLAVWQPTQQSEVDEGDGRGRRPVEHEEGRRGWRRRSRDSVHAASGNPALRPSTSGERDVLAQVFSSRREDAELLAEVDGTRVVAQRASAPFWTCEWC